MAAQGQMIDLVAPGFRGLNSAEAGSILSPQFCTKAQNAILDELGRLSAREGYTIQTTTAITPSVNVESLHEFRQGDGTRSLIVAWDGGISTSIANPEGSDISGAVTDTDGRWWFQNFNNKVIGFQDGQKPIVYTGTGSFATVVESSGTAPTSFGGIALCAYGRVWAVDSDGVTIKYSDLLQEAAWGSAGAGSIDLSNIWTQGMDTIRALAAFNATLVVFGDNHIVFIADGQGSSIGIDPTNIYVADIIEGTGCMTQWSVQHVGESDLLFLSRNGVQSLQRVIQEKSNPITNQSRNVREQLMNNVRSESDVDDIRSFYSPKLGVYGLTCPTSETTWIFDQRYKWRDKEGFELATVTRWTLAPRSWLVRDNDDIYLGVLQEVGLYSGSSDDGAAFRFIYQSPWLDLGEQLANRLKILKRISSILYVSDSATLLFKWAKDFEQDFSTRTKVLTGDAQAEFGVAEFNEDEFSGGLALRIIKVNAAGTGQYYRFVVEGDITGSFAFQQLELFTKIGRLA